MYKRLLILMGITLFVGCLEKVEKPPLDSSIDKTRLSFFNDFENDSFPSFWYLNKNQIHGDRNKFLHFNKEDLYGATFNFELPDSFRVSSAVVKVSFKYRCFSNKNGKYVFTAKDSKEQLLWHASNFSGKIGEWEVFSDSILVPAAKKGKTELTFYGYNPDKAEFDIDSLTITIENKIFPSYLTDVKKNFHLFPNVKLNNPIFESVSVASFISGNPEPVKFELENDNSALVSNKHLDIEVEQLRQGNSYLFGSVTKFKIPTKVNRLALVYKYKGKISEVYRNNRIASELMGNEAWLARQGFKISNDSVDWICYGSKKVSSFQVLKEEKLLIVNLDWMQDHPLFHFPELDSIINVKEDASAFTYTKYSPELANFFSMSKSKKVKSAPRILPTQHGYQSAFLWTEHADFTDIRLHKITYFGDENSKGPSTSRAGFAHHKIPVTKSVFYTVNDTLKNGCYKDAIFDSETASLIKTDGFRMFLDTLYSLGNEICLHTPDFFTTNERTMERALHYVTTRYGSNTWIDHGYNNGKTDNRENLMCDGLNSYSKNLWEKHHIKYFWNGYFEDTLIQKSFIYSQSITVPYHGFEDQVPYPLYWETQRSGSGFYSWRTNTVFFPEGEESWNYFFSDEKLKDFTDHYGVEFSHIYPAHTGHMGFWKYDADSNFVIEPGFENTLQKMVELRNKGILQIPTVSEFMDHQLAIEKVTYSIEDYKITIKNNGESIDGLTMAIKRKGLSPDFHKQFKNHRLNGDDLIFWFNMRKGEERVINF